MLATAFILGQFALGFLHHRKFKQTHQPTRYGTTHLWFGRAIIVLGIMNAFLYVSPLTLYSRVPVTDPPLAA